MKPQIIVDLEKKLLDAMEEDRDPSITIIKAAEVVGMDVDCLRQSISQGTCPFGVGGKNGDRGNRFGKVPKVAIWNWMMKGGQM